jgi:HSP20 family protein
MAEQRKQGEQQQQQGQRGQAIQRARAPGRALSPFEEMERMFESFFPRGWLRPFRGEWPMGPEFMPTLRAPRVDVLDRDNEIVVRAEIPGVSKEDLDVSLTDDTVTIRGTARHEEEREEKGQYYRRELEYGEFSRTVTLPTSVDTNKAAAKFHDGILELTLPKMEGAKRRTVKIEEA